MYEFGEVAVVSGSAIQRVPASNNARVREKIQGTAQQGISTDLQQLARSADFTLPAAGTIQWYAQLSSFRSPCDNNYDSTNGEGPNKPSANWGVLDRTEFVLQLVRAGDNTVIATLDSVGVNATDTTSQGRDTRFGSGSSAVKHSMAIPTGYGGTLAYVRLSPGAMAQHRWDSRSPKPAIG